MIVNDFTSQKSIGIHAVCPFCLPFIIWTGLSQTQITIIHCFALSSRFIRKFLFLTTLTCPCNSCSYRDEIALRANDEVDMISLLICTKVIHSAWVIYQPLWLRNCLVLIFLLQLWMAFTASVTLVMLECGASRTLTTALAICARTIQLVLTSIWWVWNAVVLNPNVPQLIKQGMSCYWK